MNKLKKIQESSVKLEFPNYGEFISKQLFQEYYENDTYDLILKTGQEKQEFYCHRIMLGFASDFLSHLISTTTPGTVPVLLLPDIKTSVVSYVLMFVYRGQVCVPNEHYEDFLDACRLLELKGIPGDIKEKEEEESEEIDDDDEIFMLMDVEDADGNTLENASNVENDEDPSTSSTNYIKNRGDGEFRPMNPIKVEITPENSKQFYNRVVQVIKSTYQNFGVPLTKKVQNNIKNTKLVVSDNKLLKSDHICALCDRNIAFPYRTRLDPNGKVVMRAWVNSSFSKHMKDVHKKNHLFLMKNNKFGLKP